MTQQAHTPLPWHNDCFQIKSEATGDNINHTGFGCLPINRSSEAEANAAFIVRACNNHYELLETLQDVFLMMDEQILVRNTDKDNEPDWAIKSMAFVARLKRAQIAIEKATA